MKIRKPKVKVAKNHELRVLLFMISGMALFPLVYFQQRLFSGTMTEHHYKNSSAIHKSLETFYSVKAERRQHLLHSMEHHPRPVANPKILTAFLEPTNSLSLDKLPLPERNTSAKDLKKIVFPKVTSCSTLMQDFPVDEYPLEDPFLPWIHDYFPNEEGDFIHFVAQNRRRCNTGEQHEDTMKFWEPQIALFQPIPIVADSKSGSYRLAANHKEATHNATRFQCHFHSSDGRNTITTFSEYNFDYEYVNWRKISNKHMFEPKGKDTLRYWLSQLMINCPVPPIFQEFLRPGAQGGPDKPSFYLDLIPIRTPVRRAQVMLTSRHTGLKNLPAKEFLFDTAINFGHNHYLPQVEDVGRWANLPICRRDKTGPESRSSPKKQHRLVACTWTSSSYTRRGDIIKVSDNAKRLEEWIHFHLLVGFDHLFIYDNSGRNSTDLSQIVSKFSKNKVTYHRWNCQTCNNNRPGHHNPGERSSQYAAEASCRERYGTLTEWMSFIDTDEYLVPMKANERGEYNWNAILDEMDSKDVSILKFLSSRGKPRMDFMEPLDDQSTCQDPAPVKGPNKDKTELCIGPKTNATFLQVYNCEFIRPPKPKRFQRAMKQIYRPSHVYSHFVHYSTVTADIAETYEEFVTHSDPDSYVLGIYKSTSNENELFLDELNQGSLVHARSVLPHETKRRSAECHYKSKWSCNLGYLCEDEVPFSDEKHKDNIFQNADGRYCNCWRNPVIDNFLVPLLSARLQFATS